jgi:DnaJ-class molecular chaperone
VAANPYETLGVKPDATEKEIRAAYRKLAKELHPDLNPGNREAEEKFKTVASAWDLLGDPEKRARFDRGEIDASGTERPQQQYYRDFQEAGTSAHPYASAAGQGDFDDVLAELLRARGEGRRQFRMRGPDAHYQLPIEFLDAVNGATKRISLPGGSTLDVGIPAGTEDGQVLRLRGKGGPGIGDAPPGDALVTVIVLPHPHFSRKGDDIELELPVTLREAILGGSIEVPTPDGRVRMKVPKGANSGTRLRLQGKGAKRADGSRGDEYVTLKVVLPEEPDSELETFLQGWSGARDQNPRRHLEGAA